MRTRHLLLPLPLAFALLSASACSAQEPQRDKAGPDPRRPAAFAGALGYGAEAKGGHGGKIIAVTTLADSGPGSLRACIDAMGPRVCIFRVSGLIRYTTKPPIVRNPFITIAGQTAPGPGITIANAGGEVGLTPLVIRDSHDVIVRHVRVRLDRPGPNRGSQDAFTIYTSRDVILDHVSGSWALDELVNGYADNDRITVSWSIFGEGIPRHDKCALLGSDPKGPQNFSFIGNLCAHNGDRNPDINFPPKSCVEVVNNVFYNAQSQFAETWESYGGTPVSIVGNSFIKGPDTAEHAVGLDLVHIGSTGKARIYRKDNQFEGDFVRHALDLDMVSVPEPPCPLTIKPLKAEEAKEAVLTGAGAFPRDDFDRRMVSDTRERTGHIVHQAGLILPIASAHPYPDADGDGMDDGWERTHGADPTRYDPWDDADKDGVANLDAFLDDLHTALVSQPEILRRMMR
ncbi:MAG TPA: pectate lyase [Sphingobium sp.]